MSEKGNQSTSGNIPQHVPTMDHKGRRKWIYPDRRSGNFSDRRKVIAYGLMIFYVTLPWLVWNTVPLLRLNLHSLRAHVFGLNIHLSDAAIIAPFAGVAAFLLLFSTVLKGRVWCGYVCPQTVFVEWAIRPLEEFFEGNSHHRKISDQKPLNLSRILRKLGKHTTFLALAALVANTFLAYFFGPHEVLRWMTQSPMKHQSEFLFTVAFIFLFYADLAWFREQFCAFVCPYARFQSVMIDGYTPTVGYDQSRGEPRGKQSTKNSAEREIMGDCIDCGLCQRVCPTGIDIRNGLQLECVRCARCIDACDSIMKNLKRPLGLIRITSQNELTGIPIKPWWLRRKLIATLLVLVTLASISTYRIVTRPAVDFEINRASGQLYTVMPDGRLGNLFTIRFSNNTAQSQKIAIHANANLSIEILCATCGSDLAPFSQNRVNIIIVFPKAQSNASIELYQSNPAQSTRVSLLGPRQN